MNLHITRPDILDALRRVMRQHGFDVDIILATPNGANFSRVTASPDVLDSSYGAVADELGSQAGVAVPRVYAKPEDGVTLVSYCAGAGYTGDDTNPNPSGMGLVAQEVSDVALGVTFADAPGMIVVHVPTGLSAAVSGIGHLLAKGTIPQTIDLLRQKVEAFGETFSPRDLWVVLSPGLRTYALDDRGKGKFDGIDPAILKQVFTETPDGPKAHSLDLTDLVWRLWTAAGVPAGQIGVDERNTATERGDDGLLALPSKAAADQRGEPGYASGILAIAVWRD